MLCLEKISRERGLLMARTETEQLVSKILSVLRVFRISQLILANSFKYLLLAPAMFLKVP